MAVGSNLLFVGLAISFVTLSHGLINQNCDHKCVLAGDTYCAPIPCPYFPCDVPLEYTKGDCCEHCPTQNQTNVADFAQVRRDDPYTTPCPFPCTQGGQKFCYHIPCPLAPCAHSVTTPGECCPHCPNGPTCTINGVSIRVGVTQKVGSLTCHCKSGGIQGEIDCV